MAESSTTQRSPSAPTPLPTCRCGHDRYHHFARAKPRYGLMAWILLFSGASATPREITFTCGRCGEVIEHTRDTTITREFLNQ